MYIYIYIYTYIYICGQATAGAAGCRHAELHVQSDDTMN